MFDYSEFTLKNTRLQEQKKNGLFCDCKWCWIAQLKNKEYEKYYNSIKKVGRPGTIEKAEATPLCSYVLEEVVKELAIIAQKKPSTNL